MSISEAFTFICGSIQCMERKHKTVRQYCHTYEFYSPKRRSSGMQIISFSTHSPKNGGKNIGNLLNNMLKYLKMLFNLKQVPCLSHY